jgi:hypothetical protein
MVTSDATTTSADTTDGIPDACYQCLEDIKDDPACEDERVACSATSSCDAILACHAGMMDDCCSFVDQASAEAFNTLLTCTTCNAGCDLPSVFGC